MTASPVAVPYALDADASNVAHAADRALEGSGVHVWYDSDDDTVWIMGRNRAIADAERFAPGQQLVVESGGAWRIESVARRHQLSRKKGSRKPEGAVVVSRPGKWGNPFTTAWVRLDDETLTTREARMIAVQTFNAWLTDDAYAAPFPPSMHNRRAWFLQHLHELRGKDLCCWCPLPDEGDVDWCHAAVLMDLAPGAVAP